MIYAFGIAFLLNYTTREYKKDDKDLNLEDIGRSIVHVIVSAAITLAIG